VSRPGTRIVALAVPETGPDLLSSIEAGTSGYVTPDGTVGDLVDAIERVARGKVACSLSVAARLFDRIADLAVDRHHPDSPVRCDQRECPERPKP
jgi:DNA-binding NarL/FixJ family response regulator